MSAAFGPVVGETVIRQLNPSILLFSAPFHRAAGLEVGVRMSAIKLASTGELVLYNPTNLDEPTKTALDGFGPVRYIIAPNVLHHGFIIPYNTAYPGVHWIMPETLPEKHKDFKVDYELKDPNTINIGGWDKNELEIAYFPDFGNKDINLFHHPTSTLFVCDMLWNLPSLEQYSQVADKSRQPSHSSTDHSNVGVVQSLADGAMHSSHWLHKATQWTLSKNTDNFKKWADIIVNTWKPKVIVPEHGDVITNGAEERLKERFAAALKH